MAFTPVEAGKFYKVAINLFGDDTGNNEPPGLPQLLYTFTFGQFPFFQKNYQTITAQAGEKSYSVSREVNSEKLDEDPGKTTIDVTPGIPGKKQTISLPQLDEIYAVVSLTSDSRSETQKISI